MLTAKSETDGDHGNHSEVLPKTTPSVSSGAPSVSSGPPPWALAAGMDLMQVGNDALGSGVAQPAAAWMSDVQLKAAWSWFVTAGKKCFSKSGSAIRRKTAQKSDIAISQGIAVEQVPAWVGDNHRPCVSDAHDMVLVAGSLEGMALRQTRRRSYKDVLVPPPPPLTPAPPKPSLPPLWHAVPLVSCSDRRDAAR